MVQPKSKNGGDLGEHFLIYPIYQIQSQNHILNTRKKYIISTLTYALCKI